MASKTPVKNDHVLEDETSGPKDSDEQPDETFVKTLSSNTANLSDRRLSCQELEDILQKLRDLTDLDVKLPLNNRGVIECHLLKTLKKEDAMETIRTTVDGVRAWLDDLQDKLQEHVASHSFQEIEREIPGRSRHETEAKEVDSGIASGGINLVLPIQETNDRPDAEDRLRTIEIPQEQRSSARESLEGSRSEVSNSGASGKCGACATCPECSGSEKEVRRSQNSKYDGRRMAVTSVSGFSVQKSQKSNHDTD